MSSREEQDFLEGYDSKNYESIFVATDVVAFSVSNEVEENYRKVPQKTFNILLIKRGEHPFKDQWALPGGFVKPNENAETTALRELREETGVEDVYLEQLYTFSEPNRDPRARILSVSYLALLHQKTLMKASTDAKEVAWFEIGYDLQSKVSEAAPDGMVSKEEWKLTLRNKNETLEAQILVTSHHKKGRVIKKYDVIKSQNIAFDHGKIIAFAIQRLRGKMEYSDVAFYLLPEHFTLKALQQVYEIVLDRKLIDANFRRKMAPFVVETSLSQHSGSRTAKLYAHNVQERIE